MKYTLQKNTNTSTVVFILLAFCNCAHSEFGHTLAIPEIEVSEGFTDTLKRASRIFEKYLKTNFLSKNLDKDSDTVKILGEIELEIDKFTQCCCGKKETFFEKLRMELFRGIETCELPDEIEKYSKNNIEYVFMKVAHFCDYIKPLIDEHMVEANKTSDNTRISPILNTMRKLIFRKSHHLSRQDYKDTPAHIMKDEIATKVFYISTVVMFKKELCSLDSNLCAQVQNSLDLLIGIANSLFSSRSIFKSGEVGSFLDLPAFRKSLPSFFKDTLKISNVDDFNTDQIILKVSDFINSHIQRASGDNNHRANYILNTLKTTIQFAIENLQMNGNDCVEKINGKRKSMKIPVNPELINHAKSIMEIVEMLLENEIIRCSYSDDDLDNEIIEEMCARMKYIFENGKISKCITTDIPKILALIKTYEQVNEVLAMTMFFFIVANVVLMKIYLIKRSRAKIAR